MAAFSACLVRPAGQQRQQLQLGGGTAQRGRLGLAGRASQGLRRLLVRRVVITGEVTRQRAQRLGHRGTGAQVGQDQQGKRRRRQHQPTARGQQHHVAAALGNRHLGAHLGLAPGGRQPGHPRRNGHTLACAPAGDDDRRLGRRVADGRLDPAVEHQQEARVVAAGRALLGGGQEVVRQHRARRRQVGHRTGLAAAGQERRAGRRRRPGGGRGLGWWGEQHVVHRRGCGGRAGRGWATRHHAVEHRSDVHGAARPTQAGVGQAGIGHQRGGRPRRRRFGLVAEPAAKPALLPHAAVEIQRRQGRGRGAGQIAQEQIQAGRDVGGRAIGGRGGAAELEPRPGRPWGVGQRQQIVVQQRRRIPRRHEIVGQRRIARSHQIVGQRGGEPRGGGRPGGGRPGHRQRAGDVLARGRQIDHRARARSGRRTPGLGPAGRRRFFELGPQVQQMGSRVQARHFTAGVQPAGAAGGTDRPLLFSGGKRVSATGTDGRQSAQRILVHHIGKRPGD